MGGYLSCWTLIIHLARAVQTVPYGNFLNIELLSPDASRKARPIQLPPTGLGGDHLLTPRLGPAPPSVNPQRQLFLLLTKVL